MESYQKVSELWTGRYKPIMWSCWWYGIALSATSFYLGSVLVKQGNILDEIEPVHASEHSEAIN